MAEGTSVTNTKGERSSSPQRVRPVADLKRANSPQDESAVADLRRKWSTIPRATAVGGLESAIGACGKLV